MLHRGLGHDVIDGACGLFPTFSVALPITAIRTRILLEMGTIELLESTGLLEGLG
jgi:hypothetical protein